MILNNPTTVNLQATLSASSSCADSAVWREAPPDHLPGRAPQQNDEGLPRGDCVERQGPRSPAAYSCGMQPFPRILRIVLILALLSALLIAGYTVALGLWQHCLQYGSCLGDDFG